MDFFPLAFTTYQNPISARPKTNPLAHAPPVPILYRGMRYLGVPLLNGYPDGKLAEATIIVPGPETLQSKPGSSEGHRGQ